MTLVAVPDVFTNGRGEEGNETEVEAAASMEQLQASSGKLQVEADRVCF